MQTIYQAVKLSPGTAEPAGRQYNRLQDACRAARAARLSIVGIYARGSDGLLQWLADYDTETTTFFGRG